MRWGGVTTNIFANSPDLPNGLWNQKEIVGSPSTFVNVEVEGNDYSNLSSFWGGAVVVWQGSSFKDSGSTYQKNGLKINQPHAEDGKELDSIDYGDSERGGAIFNGFSKDQTSFHPSQATVTSSLFLKNGTVNLGGAVYNESGSDFISVDNNFKGNTSQWAGGAIFNGAAREDTQGEKKVSNLVLVGKNEFEDNSATWFGGAIVNSGKVQDETESETTFTNNKTEFRGGAFVNLGNFTELSSNVNFNPFASIVETTAVFNGTVIFKENVSTGSREGSTGGGAVSNYSWGKPVEKTILVFGGDTTFISNQAQGSGFGGAILNSDAELHLIGVQKFNGNSAGGFGGAIANFGDFGNSSYLEISGQTEFKENFAECGGAIYNGLATATIDNSLFEENRAVVSKGEGDSYRGGNGGAVLNGGYGSYIAEMQVSNSIFKGNIAEEILVYETYAYGGGAVMNFTGSTFTSLNNKYVENTAGNVGGAIHNRQGETTQLILSGNNFFEGNSAKRGGGAIFNHGQVQNLDENSYTEFKGNSTSEGFGGALMNVGGIYAFDGKNQENVISSFQGTVVFEGNTAKKAGGAIANIAHPTVLVSATGKPINPDTTYQANTIVEFSGNVLFSKNTSESHGGAVYNKDGEVTFRGSTNVFSGNEAAIAGALMNLQLKHGVSPAYMEVSGDTLFENNRAHTAAGAVYNNANMVFGQGNHIFRGNSVVAGTGGAIYNVDTGTITFGGNNYFELNTAQGVLNDIFNKGKIVFGSEANPHNITVINGGVTGPGGMELNTGRLVLGSGAQIHQASFTAKAGTMTTVVLSDAHHVHDKNVAHFDELADENGTGHDKVATAVTNNGFGIHTTGQMTLEKGAILNIVSDDIQAGHTYLVAYNEEAAETQVAKMVSAAESSVVVKPAGFEHDETSWKGENLISSNPLVKLERVEGDNTNGYILVTSKNSNSISIIEDLAGLDQVYFSWLSDLEDLRQRLGEVRLGADNGIWTKVSYARYRASGLGDGKVKSTDYSIHVGADGTLYKNNGHKFFAGFSFKGGHTDMKAARAAGTGDLNHYTWKLYGTYVHEKGSYADIVASVGTFNNRFRGYHDSWTGQVHGDVNNWGAGISGEVGHQFRFLEESAGSFWFAEPQIQLSYFRVKGKNYETSNAIYVEQKSVNFLTGRVGVSAGKQFAYGADKKRYLQLSAKAGLIHEFAGDQKLRLNEKKLSADGKKNLFYYGADMDWQFADNHKLYLKVDRATGSGYRKDIQIQGGYRYSF